MFPVLFAQQTTICKNKPEYLRLQNNNMWSTPRFLALCFFYLYQRHIFSPLKISFHLFANGTCIFGSNKNYKKLEDEINTSLDNITNWPKANKLMINVKKSNLIFFKVGNNQSADETIKIYIENQTLEPKDTAKYLGVYIDKGLSWDRHIENINSKLNRGIGISKPYI